LKKHDGNKETTRSTLIKNRISSVVATRLTHLGHKLKILPADLSSKIDFATKNLSIHFPEGGMVTLRFCLIRSETDSHAYDQQIYQLTDIELGLEMVRLQSEAINSIKKELKSVSLRHTS
jgi:hypothetical protein